MSPTESRRRVADLTVVVTSFNHQAYVEQCLDSIAAQTLPPRQVVLIDDCSSDDSAAVVEHWLATSRKRYPFTRHGRNLGVCASVNEGLALAGGRFFCQVSADDWLELDRFERQVAAFERADSNAGWLVGDIREVDAGGATIVDHDFGKRLGHMCGRAMQPELLSRLLAENVVPAPGVLIRTDVIREAGGYNESLAFEDYDMWLRLSTRYSMAYEPGIVANYRLVDSGLMRNIARRVSVLSSEAAMLAKHAGSSAATDETIVRRLVGIAGKILELGEAAALRRVLRSAALVSNMPWLRSAARISRVPGGLAYIRKTHATELGYAKAAPAPDA